MCGKKASALFAFLAGFGLALVFAACVTEGSLVPGSGLTGARQPEWVRDPYTKYSRQANVAAVGSGATREAAEKSALGNLVAIFGQSVQVDERVSTSYQAAVENGVTATWSEDVDVESGVTTSAGLDSLVGAEIAEVWHNGGSAYYAAAVLNKAKAALIYSDLVASNQKMIGNLVNMPDAEKNTLNGLARYQFAATVADVTVPYVNLLSVIGAPPPEVKRGDDYRLEALAISKAIPVGIAVQNDKSGRIEGAFAKALSGLGFAGGGNNPPYTLAVNIVTTPVEVARNQNKFTRIELEANFTDTTRGVVLLPFNFNSREGHLSQAEADNRAYTAAARKIDEEYAAFFSGFLSRLLPTK